MNFSCAQTFVKKTRLAVVRADDLRNGADFADEDGSSVASAETSSAPTGLIFNPYLIVPFWQYVRAEAISPHGSDLRDDKACTAAERMKGLNDTGSMIKKRDRTQGPRVTS